MSKRVIFVVLLALLAAAFYAPTPAQAAVNAVIVNVYTENCSIFVEAFTEDPAVYAIEFWDDGVLLAVTEVETLAAGDTIIGQVNVGVLAQGAPGIGILVYGDGLFLTKIDPYEPDLAAHCGAGADMVAIPSSAVVGAFVAPADVYWGPDPEQISNPLVTLAAGKTVWVVGKDASGDFYKIIFAGKSLWVRAETLGPNFDEVWNGTPLPTNTVQ